MATMSVVILAALTVYIVVGLLVLYRVPDPGSAWRRFVELAVWPLFALRAVARPSHRRRVDQPTVEPGVPVAAGPVLAAAAAAPVAAEPLVAGPVAAEPVRPEPVAAAPEAAQPVAAAPEAAQPMTPEPPDEPVDRLADWERFVRRLASG